MEYTKKNIIASAILAVIICIAVLNALSLQKDFGTPEEFRDAYNNSLVSGAKIIYTQNEKSGEIIYSLDNGMHIAAYTDDLNGRIKLLMIAVNEPNDFSIKDFETTCKKVLFSINKVHILEFDEIEKFVQSNEGAILYGIGGISLNKFYENKLSCIFVYPSSE